MKKDINLLLAEILKPHGIKGELKARLLVDVGADLSRIKIVVANGTEYKVEEIRLCDGDFCIIRLAGINDRNLAESLRGCVLEVDEENRPPLPEGNFYICDIINSTVVDEKEEILGILTEVLQYGAADVYCVDGKKPFMFPAIQAVIMAIEPNKKRVTRKREELEKVAVYED